MITVCNNIIKSMNAHYTSAVGIVIREGSILLGKAISDDDRNDKWCLPGGGIEEDESSLQAAMKKLELFVFLKIC